MEFKKKDYLTATQIKELITSQFTQDQAGIIADKLQNYCFISGDVLYELQDNITYRSTDNMKLELINKVSELIQTSYKMLDEKDIENITLKHRQYKNIFKNSNIDTYYPQLLKRLIRKDIIFNNTPGEIHFKNGYMIVSTKTFKKRDVNKHFVSKFIDRDYEVSTEKQRNKVLHHIKKVYPSKDDMDCILLYLGSALSWKATVDQTALFLLGLGSSGKSFILSLTKKVMECYFLELQGDTFATKNKKIDKILNSYKNDPQYLYSWVNEPEDKRMNGALFKVWVDGKLQSTMLYKDGQFNFEHHSVCITTANTMPQIIVEKGTTRRIVSYTHNSVFTEDESIVDKSKNVYMLNKFIIDELESKRLLNAWFDILVEYCCKWLSGLKPNYTDNFLETKEAIVSTSDVFQDFIDAKLVITNDEKDKIGKETMRKLFLEMYPDRHLTTIQVMTSLKEHKIMYNTNIRSEGNVRGCYYGVKIKQECDDDDYEFGIDKVDQSVDINKEWAKKYAELEAKYNELVNVQAKEVPNDEKPKKVKKNKVIKKSNDDDEFLDDDMDNFVKGMF